MARFDVDVWKARATDRFHRATATGKADATSRLERDLAYVDALAIVVAWCVRKKLDVVFGREANGTLEGKQIRINGRLGPEQQLYVLIHECGHYLIGDREKDERFGRGYNAEDPSEKRTLIHRVDVVDEEFEAWDRGRKLAGRLGVKLDKEAFDKARASYLKSYMKWALRVDGYGGPIDGGEEEDNQT